MFCDLTVLSRVKFRKNARPMEHYILEYSNTSSGEELIIKLRSDQSLPRWWLRSIIDKEWFVKILPTRHPDSTYLKHLQHINSKELFNDSDD